MTGVRPSDAAGWRALVLHRSSCRSRVLEWRVIADRRRCLVDVDDRLRFDVPLYTVAEAARIVGVPATTLSTWAKGYVRRFAGRPDVVGAAAITYITPARRGDPALPFVGLAEALVLAAVRRSGVPMQRVRPALEMLEREIGVEHALASRRLYTDGAEILYEYSASMEGEAERRAARELVVIRSGQRVFTDVLQHYLRQIEYDTDGYARLIHVPVYEVARVVADPSRSFGAPVFEKGAARIDDVLQRFWAGESLEDLVEEFGVPLEQLEDVLRVASRRAA